MDYQEIIDRKLAIVNSPIKRIPAEVLDKVTNQFHKQNPKSYEYSNQMKTVVPGGLQHNLGSTDPFALVFKKAKSDKIYDIDGNEYVDYLMDGGPIILGHHFEPLDSEVVKVISESGPAVGLTHENELRFAKEIVNNIPGVEMVRFLASGTEADMLAIRIARVYTGKEIIIKIGGNYHGWSDQLLISTNFPGTGASEATGIPSGCYENTIEVNQNDFNGLVQAFEQHKGKIAAVLAEPTGGHAGTFIAHPDWNQTMRDLCDQNGAVLIFDEVVAGFRLSLGGGQAYYGVTPDLTVMGKIISHGYAAAGAVGGKKEVMQYCHPSSVNGNKAFTGGTLSANPVMVTAGFFAMKYIKEYQAIEKAAAYADKLTKALNDLFSTRKDLPFFVYNIQSIMHLETSCYNGISLIDNPASRVAEVTERYLVLKSYDLALMAQGILPLGDRFYCCMQHNDESLQKTLNAWEYVLSLIPVN
ncbi:aspartate aminotransferase family protein [Pelolinea submarina]|uniref:Glutamate-1-semialdehyde 2,1-aminomutase n=1 Tax=Pelolinea submarina TaxID=913107 RepID=A0A347ZWE0_9CHLR|nr:aminotransferase class III-fold pyridoxal phosphate-dependent enzyme [Pelolinea submarina]REG05364.1 glutamate-1-semialdehyde 2,1-aminomutase [Pelolinea submarina]BBB49621.1 glutamate-1-semialdehyde 2,1-aminomutase [Pelolinea submarina]